MNKYVSTLLLGALMLLGASRLSAQALEPGFGAPVNPINVCNSPATFSVKIIGGISACAQGGLSLQLPAGFVYVGGSAIITTGTSTVSESSFSGNTANLIINNIPVTPGFSIVSYQAYAGCSALANPVSANNQAVYSLTSACAPVSNTTSNSFNIQSASLSISNVTNNSYIGAVDDMYTRTITITNSGLGSVSNITLTDTSGNGLYVKGISVSGGWNFLTSKTVIGTDTVTTFSLSGSELTQGQSISLIENVSLVNDCFLQSRLGAWFGCDNTTCVTGNIAGNSTAGATLNYSYLPQLKLIPDQQDLSCRDNIYSQTFRLTNTGSAPLRDLAINLFSTAQNSAPALQLFNSTNNIQSSQSAYQGFEYKLGVSGAWSSIALTQSSNFASPAACLSGMSANVDFTIPKLNPGDTIFVRYNERDCAVNTPVNDVLYTAGSILRYNYRASCNTRTSPVSSFIRTPLKTSLAPLPLLPTRLDPSINYTFEYHFPSATSDLYKQTGANGSSIRLELQLTDNLNFTGSISDISLINSAGTVLASPTAFGYNPGSHIITATYSFTTGFSYSDLQNSYIKFGQINLDCAVPVPVTTATLNGYLKNLSTCTQEEFIFSRQDPLNINCPEPVCGSNGGLRFSAFQLRRTNYGLPDNDNNGVPDAAGVLDMTKVRTNFAMLGDTIVAAFYGRVQTGPFSPAAGFNHGYAIDTISNPGNHVTNLYAVVDLYASGNNTPFYTSNNLPVDQVSPVIRKVDFSIAALQASNPLPGGYAQYANGDSIVVRIYYKIAVNTGTAVVPVSFSNAFYVSDIADPMAADQYHCGNKPMGVVNLVGYTPTSSGAHTYTLVGPGTVATVLDNMLKLAPAEMAAGNKPFVYEYRPISIYNQMTYTLPAGYDYISASVTYSFTNGVGTSTSLTAGINPINPAGNPLIFDINQLFQNGSFPKGDQGSLLTATVTIRPNCVAPASSGARFTLRQTAAPGSTFTDHLADVTDSIFYTAPNIFASPSTAQHASNTNVVSWEIQITNASVAQALRVWMAKAPGGSVTITSVQRLSGSGGTVLNIVTPNGNGIYQLGNYAQVSTYYLINATYLSCDKDSLKLFYGYDCNNSGYPTSAIAATYKKELPLYVSALQPSLQTTIVSGPASLPTKDYCDVLTYELETMNTGMGEVNTLSINAYLPGSAGSAYVPGSFQLQYPAGSGSYLTIPDAAVSISGSNIIFSIPSSELTGLFADESFRIKFGLTTSCDFTNGGSFRFNSTGQSFCGLTIASAIQQSQKVNITGIPLSINTYSTDSFADTAQLDCTTGELISTYRFKIINTGPIPTTNADGFTIALPAPWQMDPSSLTFIRNPSGSAFTSVNGAGAYEFSTGAGLQVGDSVILTATITVPASAVPTVIPGNSAPVTENAIVKYGGTCSFTGTPCPLKDSIISSSQVTTIHVPNPIRTINTPVLIITPPAPVCEPATVDITQSSVTVGSTAGLMYTYFTDAGATTALTNPEAIAVSGTYYIKGTSPGGCTDVKPVTVVINPLPVASISYTGSLFCAVGTATVTQTGTTGGTYSSSPVGLAINSSTGEIDLAASTPGTYTITYSFSDGTCPNTTTTSITIENIPTLVVTDPAPICPPLTVDLTNAAITTGSTAGLTFRYYNDATGTTVVANPSAIGTSGTYYIQGSTANGCLTTIQPVNVTILVPPVANISYAGSPFCVTGTAAVTKTGQTGGIYSSTPAGLVINGSTGEIDLAASNPGIYTITYSFTNGTCPNTTTTSITIDNIPTLVVTDPAPVCQPLTVDLTDAAITAGSTAGLTFQYYSDATGTTVVANPSAIGTSGIYYIQGSTAGGCLTAIQPVNVTINLLPVASISYAGSPFCGTTGTAVVTQTGQTGGIYSSSPAGLSINNSTGQINLAGTTPGTYNITYSFTNGTCPNTATTSIILEEIPTLVITDPAHVCAPLTVNITNAAITAGSTTGLTFQYYSEATGTTVAANPSAIGASGTYYIQGSTANGCLTPLQPVVVTIDPLPVASINYDGSLFCATGTVTVIQTGQTGGTYSSSSAGLVINSSTGEIDLAASTPGTYTITYSFTNGTCPNTTTTNITIENTLTLLITNPSPVCAPLTVNLTNAAITAGSTNGLTFQYYSDATGTTAIANPSAIGASGTYYIQGSTANGCLTPIQPVILTINPLPIATINYAGSLFCATGTAVVTQTGQTGGIYSSSPAGLVINSSTGEIDLAASTPGTYAINYSFTNGICPNTTTTSITIENILTLVITNAAPVCSPNTADLTLTAITTGSTAGLTFQYYSDATGTTVVGNPSAIGTSGTYYIQGSTVNGCLTPIQPVTVTILIPPVANISYAGSPFCVAGTAAVTQTGTTGGSYSSSPVGLAINSGTGEINLAASTPGTYTITYSFTNGTCPNTTTASITINNIPTLAITDPAPVCPPLTVDITDAAITAGSTAGLTFQHYSDAAGTTVIANPSAIGTSGTYYIQGSTANGCLTPIQPVTVTILVPPVANISYAGSPFCGTTGTAAVTQTGTAGGSYSSSPVGLAINSTTGEINMATSIPGTYSITYNFTNGTCANTTTTSIIIENIPTLVVADPAAVCPPLTVDLTNAAITAGSTSGLTFRYYTDATGTTVVTNAAAIGTSGIYYIQGSTANGCLTAIQPVNVTVHPLPVANISYGRPYCVANTTTAMVTRTGQAGGVYSAPAGLSINASTGTLDVAASTPGVYTVTYGFTNGNCPGTTTTSVNIEGIPVLVVSNPTAVCAPNTIDLTSAAITTGSTAGLAYRYYSDAAGTVLITQPAAINVSGLYYIKGFLPGGCETELKPVLVVINAQPLIIASADTIICRNDSAMLTASSAGNSITWLNQSGGNTITVHPLTTTVYTVIATSPMGCTARSTVNVQVRNFDVLLSADKLNAPIGSTVLLSTLSNQSYSVIAWLPLQYLPDQTAQTQSFVMNDSAKLFSVVAKSIEGCVDTASILIKVDHDLKDFFIPNAMTPNRDGKNDIFRVYGSSIKAVDIRIYNSWGELIYQTTDNQKGWDGSYKGKPQPSGVYIYTVKATMYNDVILNRKGNINLIR